MKTVFKVAPLFWGLGLVVSSGSARAQTDPMRFLNSPNNAPFISHTAALAPKLREIVLRVQPQAKIEFVRGAVWRASYQSPKDTTHLVDEQGNLLKAEGEFPANFSEFSLELAQDEDAMYYRLSEDARYQPETFGTTLTTRANVKLYFPTITRAIMERYGNGDLDVPLGHWAYEAFIKLAQAGLVKDWKPRALQDMPLLLRREFAWIVVHMRNHIQQEPPKPALSEELMAALTDLESEFALEISDWDEKREPLAGKPISLKAQVRGMTRQPRYRFLSLRFSYGKGVPGAFVEGIRRAIEDYAAQKLRESSVIVIGNKG